MLTADTKIPRPKEPSFGGTAYAAPAAIIPLHARHTSKAVGTVDATGRTVHELTAQVAQLQAKRSWQERIDG